MKHKFEKLICLLGRELNKKKKGKKKKKKSYCGKEKPTKNPNEHIKQCMASPDDIYNLN